jgi:tRNA(Ile)-lysidine synthase
MAPGNDSLEQRVAAQLKRLVAPRATCLVAVSGGPDSLALLDLLHLGAPEHGCVLVVGHIDHGIHPESARVAEHVAVAASARHLPYLVRTLALGQGTNETRARTARRAALVELAAEAGAQAIVLAHHADDQAETVLLRLLRGSGPAGLAGMAPRHGPWVRPLLGVRRSVLLDHLASRRLTAWTDPANSDPRHLRSWLRIEVLPALTARLPDIVARLDRSAAQAAEARRAWSQVPERIPGLDVQRTLRGISVAAPMLKGYRSPLRHAVLAALGRRVGVLLGQRRLAALDRLLEGQSGAAVTLATAFRAELAFGRLTLYRLDDSVPAAVRLVGVGTVTLGSTELAVGIGRAGITVRGGWTTALMPGSYAVRTWRPGDRIRPLGGAGSRAVAVLFREARIGPARRRTWPVVVTDDDATIVWVPGICRADVAVPSEGDEAWRVDCTFT